MIKRVIIMGLGLLGASAALAAGVGHGRIAWSMLLAGGWFLANGLLIAGLCHLMCVEQSLRRGWRVGAYLAAKGALYVAGYLAVVAWRPSAIGLAIGMTAGLVALLIGAARTTQVLHG